MNSTENPELTTSDMALIDATRAGDHAAFAELWRRHYRSGVRVARQFTSSLDADDLVSEAFTRIYQRVLAGGGPTGAFRPYLYTSIRNLASTWGKASTDVQVDDLADFEDPTTTDDPVAIALDRTLTARAFRSLPDRWQSVLWYTEVEGMDPHEVAPLLGMTANSVAALSYRAREGLRKAWLQAHANDATASGDCRWTIEHVGEHARHSMSARDSERMDRHLATCARCSIVSEEVDEVGSHLALVMIPIVLGGVAGGTFLASFGGAGSAMAVGTIPAMPAAIGSAAVSMSLFPVVTAPILLVAALAATAAISGSVVALAPQPTPAVESVSVAQPEVIPQAVPTPQGPIVPIEVPVAVDDPTNLGVGTVVGDLADSLVGDLTGEAPPEGHTAPGGILGADITLNLIGSATPGAHLSLQAAGQIYATTTVASDGTFVLAATAIPGGVSSLDLVQTVDRGYLATLLPGGGVLGVVTGTVDELVNGLVRPLQLDSGANGVTIVLLRG